MPRLVYETKKLRADTLTDIRRANRILEEYAAQGYDLTLRQLYYQHVARGLIPNTERSYKRLGSIVNDGRLAGLIDWEHIIDRTRNLAALTHWRNPAHIIGATARSYKIDYWANQDNYVEVWIEKDALIGVIGGVCEELDVPYFSCRGYTSQSEMWASGQRLLAKVIDGKRVTVLHLGDHDPSGIDMTRDITDRLWTFVATDYMREQIAEHDLDTKDKAATLAATRHVNSHLTVDRIALTMDQIDQYQPPPNPAKISDSRAVDYIANYGDQSWELDALEPSVLSDLIRDGVEALIEPVAWNEALARERAGQQLLRQASDEWETIVDTLNGGTP